MKVSAMLNRQKGRDFYDAMFLLSQVKPDYNFMALRTGIADLEALKHAPRLTLGPMPPAVPRLLPSVTSVLFDFNQHSTFSANWQIRWTKPAPGMSYLIITFDTYLISSDFSSTMYIPRTDGASTCTKEPLRNSVFVRVVIIFPRILKIVTLPVFPSHSSTRVSILIWEKEG